MTPIQPASTGLIRLTLRKPMGIVFEPMYDVHNPSVQKGVRICDLPRTGAAALSRTLEVGDELLSINDRTMSRLTFDEIMDFIIDADPDQVHLLFRRPNKEKLAARAQVKLMTTSTPIATNNQGSASVKWVDDDHRKKSSSGKEQESPRRNENKSSSKRRAKPKEDEEDTIQTVESERPSPRKKGSRNRRSKAAFESESFLDALIDSICESTDHVCRDRSGSQRRRNDRSFSDDEDDGTLLSGDEESTYVTYESAPKISKEKWKKRNRNRVIESDEEGEDETLTTMEDNKDHEAQRDKNISKRTSPPKEERKSSPRRSHKPSTKEVTSDTIGNMQQAKSGTSGKARTPSSHNKKQEFPDAAKAPIFELEYDGQGADVSVMESLGGPSLLIEKQRQSASGLKDVENNVSRDLVDQFGADYAVDFGYSREQTIQRDPIKFYTFVVKNLLKQHEPEKVRLSDKLLAKYKGREEHLVRKLSVRYSRPEENEGENFDPTNPEEEEGGFESAFPMDEPNNKESEVTEDIIRSDNWPSEVLENTNVETFTEEDDQSQGSKSYSESDFSGDSIDGTSPAVIAQVSELLNYVYGKTSVPGQIDRVSTIMRAYEGREAVLLELLETKALIKANAEKEGLDGLPSFLRNSPEMQTPRGREIESGDEMGLSPMSGLTNDNEGNTHDRGNRGTIIQDDISSMSGVSAPGNGQKLTVETNKLLTKGDAGEAEKSVKSSITVNEITPKKSKKGGDRSKTPDKKKKKGILRKVFGKKGKKDKDQQVV